MLHTFMAKKSMIQREKKRNRLVITYKEKRNALKQEIKNTELFEEKLNYSSKVAAVATEQQCNTSTQSLSSNRKTKRIFSRFWFV